MSISTSFADEGGKYNQVYKNTSKNKSEIDALLDFIENYRPEFKDDSEKEEYIAFIIKKEEQLKNPDKIKQANACYQIGHFIYLNSNPYDAYKYIDKATSILEGKDITQHSFTADLYKLRGEIYYSFGRFSESKSSLLTALNLNTLNDRETISTYNTLGLIYRIDNVTDSSLYYFNTALELTNEINSEEWRGIILGNLGYSHYLKNDIELAKQYLKIDKELSLENYEVESAVNAIAILLEIAIQENETKEINNYNRLLDSINLTIDNKLSKHAYYKIKTLYWEHAHQYEKALEAFQKSIAYKDSAIQEHNQLDFQNTQFQIDFEKSKAKNELLKEKEARSKQRYIGIVSMLIIILFTCIIVIYQLRKRKVHEKKILELRNEKIKTDLENNEKELKKLLKNLTEKNKIIEALNVEIEKKEEQEDNIALQNEKLELYDKIQSFSLLTENDLVEFRQIFNRIHPGFYDNLIQKNFNLSKAEVRLAMLIKLNLSTFEMAQILGISEDSVRKTNLRLRKKLDIETPEQLLEFILSIETL